VNGFIIAGAVGVAVGLVLVVTGIRNHSSRTPRHTAMLIGGMMLAAFGMVIAGFAFVYQHSAPLALNAAQATP
jgi:hypothetical protein